MEKNRVIDTLLQHSTLDVVDTSTSLIVSIEKLLNQDFKFEDISLYSKNLTVLKDVLLCWAENTADKGCDVISDKGCDVISDKGCDVTGDNGCDVISDKGCGTTVNTVEQDSSSKLDDLKLDVVEKVCLPLLGHLFPSSDSRPEILVLLAVVGQLVAVCVRSNNRILCKVLKYIDINIERFMYEKPTNYDLEHDRSVVDINTLLVVTRHLVNSVASICPTDDKVVQGFRSLFTKLTNTLEHISVELMGNICIPILLKIVRFDNVNVRIYLDIVWKYVHNFSELIDGRKQYILLCGFANYFFPVIGEIKGVDIKREPEFWEILQCGLYNKDSVNRKRSLYLLKRLVDICESTATGVNMDQTRSVFWWSKDRSCELSKTWEDFVLLAEVLEEKQIHVIKPLLPRMKSLMKACEHSPEHDQPLLHTSWLKTILLRCSHHESLQLIRWSAETVLSLDLTQCPMLEQGLDQYLSGPMLYSLQEPKLYVRDLSTPVGTLPVVAEKLAHFFVTCCNVMPSDKRVSFFCQTVQNISCRDWGPIPLLFICRGLALVPASPCLDRSTVLGLRKLLTGFLVAVDTYFRGAIQGYVIQILIKLTDKSKVPLEDFMQIVYLVRREESLQRGTTLWAQCVTWFGEEGIDQSEEWKPEGMRQYLENSVTKYLQTGAESRYSTADSATALMVARLLLLASDSSIATAMDANSSNTLIRITQTLASVLNSINTHAYMSTHKADKALLMLNLLMKEAGQKGCTPDDLVGKVIYSAVESCHSEILVYIGRQISEAIVCLSDVCHLELYADSVGLLAESMGTRRSVSFGGLVDTCTAILSNPLQQLDLQRKLKQLSSMCILGTLSKFLSHDLQKSHDLDGSRHKELRTKVCSVLKTWKLISNFAKPIGDQSLSQQEWGKISSLFLEHEWQVVEMALLHGAAPWCDMLELLALAEDTLSVGVERTSVIVLECLKVIIPQVKDIVSEERLVCTLGTCWASFQESRRILAFWDVLEAFVQATFQPCLLAMDKDSPVIAALTQYAEQLIEIGTDKNGVVNALATQLCISWSKPHMTLHAGKFVSVIVDLCMYGGLIRRGVRQVYDICAALEAEGDACPAHGLIKGMWNEDIQVRVTIVNFLCHLKPDDQSHHCLATSIIRLCTQVYVDVANGSANRFSNSLVHRQRHRLIQTVLLLQTFITEDYVAELWNFIWSSLEVETQASVRHILEWVVMWLMHRHTDLRQQLWALFEKYRETKNLTLCSLLCIVIHTGPHLPREEQADYFKQAIPNILPWCMAHHFHTRIYSQAVLAKLWEQCHQLGLEDIVKENAILTCIVDFSQQNRNSTRNVKKLLDSFFFKFMDFERDFTLETLYKIMSKMTALTEEDWIQPELFAQNSPLWNDGTGSSFIRLHNVSRDFEKCDPGLWKYIDLKSPADDDEADTNTADDNEGDVQKKIMPWRQMMLDEEAMSEVEHGVKQHIEGRLVVVTSLINKVPNLGGLCRTSEIFGVSEYVLGKMGYVGDKAFQGLSVTAHKWIPITEVHETRLGDYLQQKRQEGYTLVGVEQTANSVCLTDYTFPEKTLLLLGNEKEGIPVQLISLLDVCVEIPQQGVIRSLNVHVSGAILIWEYRRQQLMKTICPTS